MTENRKTASEKENEIREMFNLGEAIFKSGLRRLKECKENDSNFIYRRNQLIIEKRMAVVEFVHGLELILKAILIKKGYCIYKTKQKIFKINEKMKNIINEDRTIELEYVIRFFKDEYPNEPISSIDKLRELRNQIIHKGTKIGEKKGKFFLDAMDCLKRIYTKEKINHRKFLNFLEESKNYI